MDGLRDPMVKSHIYRMARAYEELIDLAVNNTVQPLHFMESLMLYYMTHRNNIYLDSVFVIDLMSD